MVTTKAQPRRARSGVRARKDSQAAMARTFDDLRLRQSPITDRSSIVCAGLAPNPQGGVAHRQRVAAYPTAATRLAALLFQFGAT